jgi:SAM-dependent methyltransferase
VVGEARRAASADAVVSVDALHLAPDLAAAGREVLRILRPSHRLVLTSWQPRTPEDARLPSRLRIDWTTALRSVGFVDVQVESRAEWHELFTRVYRVALDLGSPGEDVAPTGLQDEADGTCRSPSWWTGSWSLRPVPMAASQLVLPARSLTGN